MAALKPKSNIYEFVKRASEKHLGKYDYSKSIYINNYTPLEVICPIHGSFFPSPGNHLSGKGCRKCGLQRTQNSKTKTVDFFLEKVASVHGDYYDYSKIEYVNLQKKIKIICKQHGEFFQTPVHHLKGHGCKKCADIKTAIGVSKNTEYFIEKAIETHGNKYDYSKVNYKKAKSKVVINCPLHGEFSQTPDNHINGQGCKLCNPSSRGWIKKDWLAHCERKGITKATVYAITFQGNDERFVKIGISTNFKNRLNQIPYTPEYIRCVSLPPEEAFDLESSFLKTLVKYRYTPKIKFGGHTECFTTEIRSHVIH